MIVVLSVLVLLVGLLIYLMSGHAKRQEVGRIMFFCGLLVFLLEGGEQVISLMGR